MKILVTTISERESNARRVRALGAGEFVLLTTGENREKEIDQDEFTAKYHQKLKTARYKEAAEHVAERMRAYTGADLTVKYIRAFEKARGIDA